MMTSQLQDPVVIVGAGRSGTTMMREALSSHPDLAAPEYEMNYLWRHGNAWLSHDMLDPDRHYREWKGRYIRKRLKRLLAQTGKPRLVEKTVANVMRVGYVARVLPDTFFIHIIRDGRAVTSSAMASWQARPGGAYLASKGMTIPLTDLPVVVFRFALARVRGRLRGAGHVQSWGPRWPGFDGDVARLSLAELCARQWLLSVQAARAQGAGLGPGRYLEVRYEDVVTDPLDAFQAIAGFIGIDPSAESFSKHLSEQIRAIGLEKWRRHLVGAELQAVEHMAGELLGELGYL